MMSERKPRPVNRFGSGEGTGGQKSTSPASGRWTVAAEFCRRVRAGCDFRSVFQSNCGGVFEVTKRDRGRGKIFSPGRFGSAAGRPCRRAHRDRSWRFENRARFFGARISPPSPTIFFGRCLNRSAAEDLSGAPGPARCWLRRLEEIDQKRRQRPRWRCNGRYRGASGNR